MTELEFWFCIFLNCILIENKTQHTFAQLRKFNFTFPLTLKSTLIIDHKSVYIGHHLPLWIGLGSHMWILRPGVCPWLSPFMCLLYRAFTCLDGYFKWPSEIMHYSYCSQSNSLFVSWREIGSSVLPSVNVLLVLAHTIKHIMKHCPSKKKK